MKLLTKNSDYAVRALMHLARNPGRFVPSQEISDGQAIPLAYLRLLLQELKRNGYVESREGVSGGVKLARRPASIRLADVMKVFQGEVRISECLFRKKLCANRTNCVLREKILEIEKMLERELKAVTLAGLLKTKGDKGNGKRHHPDRP